MSYKRDMGSPHACIRIDTNTYEGKLLNTRRLHVKTVLVCLQQSYLTMVLFTI